MTDLKRALGFPILILAAVALILLLSVVDVDAQESETITHEFDLLVEVIEAEVGFSYPNERVWFTAKPAPFYDDFQLYEDGSFKFMEFTGCVSGWDCDWPDRYEVADCDLVASGANEFFDDARQFEYSCVFTEKYEDGTHHEVDYPIDFISLRQSFDGDGGPTLEISIYSQPILHTVFLPFVAK